MFTAYHPVSAVAEVELFCVGIEPDHSLQLLRARLTLRPWNLGRAGHMTERGGARMLDPRRLPLEWGGRGVHARPLFRLFHFSRGRHPRPLPPAVLACLVYPTEHE